MPREAFTPRSGARPASGRPSGRTSLCLCLLLALTGCSRNFYSAHGQIGTDGPAFGHWSSTPKGCSRDPIDGLPDNKTKTIASFFWADPSLTNPMLRDHRMAHNPDAPEQVNLLHGPAGTYEVRVKTQQNSGWLIHPEDCARLEIDTHEQGPGFPGGRPSLAGTVHLECQVKQSRLWADLTFSRCDY